jgi:adenylate cyclase class IV
MPSNVEVKFRLPDPAGFRRRAAGLAGGHETLRQEDTFFAVPRRRLKLRCFPDGTGELIYYERPNEAGPTRSQYSKCTARNAASLCGVLGEALGIIGVVRKTREVYLVGQTRIHLDDVQGLGTFGELEVALQEGQTTEGGAAVARRLMAVLEVDETDLIDRAYIDMIERQGSGSRA